MFIGEKQNSRSLDLNRITENGPHKKRHFMKSEEDYLL